MGQWCSWVHLLASAKYSSDVWLFRVWSVTFMPILQQIMTGPICVLLVRLYLFKLVLPNSMTLIRNFWPVWLYPCLWSWRWVLGNSIHSVFAQHYRLPGSICGYIPHNGHIPHSSQNPNVHQFGVNNLPGMLLWNKLWSGILSMRRNTQHEFILPYCSRNISALHRGSQIFTACPIPARISWYSN